MPARKGSDEEDDKKTKKVSRSCKIRKTDEGAEVLPTRLRTTKARREAFYRSLGLNPDNVHRMASRKKESILRALSAKQKKELLELIEDAANTTPPKKFVGTDEDIWRGGRPGFDKDIKKNFWKPSKNSAYVSCDQPLKKRRSRNRPQEGAAGLLRYKGQ